VRRPSLYQAQLIFLGALVVLVLVAGAWAALAPLPVLPKERVIVIPRGASALGPQPFPSDIRLTLGLQDVLVLRNEDDRPQLVGGIEVAAGQSLSIPFHRVQDFQLACSAHPSGQLRITVSARPDPGLGRLWWRLARLRAYLSFRSSQGAAYG
jgi:hypothetical protein